MENIINSDICFVGGVYNDEKVEYSKTRKDLQSAANNFQWKVIKGIELNLKKKINIISSKFIGSYPISHKDLFQKNYNFEPNDGVIRKQVGFLNIWGIKNLFRQRNVYKELYKWINKNDRNKIIIVYSLHLPFINAISKILKKNKNIHVHIIIPDLPEHMRLSTRKNIVYSIFKKRDTRIIKRKILKFDTYTILTRQMAKKLNLSAERCIVIEGISDGNISVNNSPNHKVKTILYTGTLNWKYGIKNLTDSFIKLDDKNLVLKIAGSGEAQDYLINISKDYSNIQYLGFLGREEVIDAQNKADILINPRENNEEYTKYSFPSKLIEYIQTGKPVISYKLSGIPNEYSKILFYVDENEQDGLSKKIKEVAKLSNERLAEIRKNSYEFIKKYKVKEIQTRRILNIISEFGFGNNK